jgi:ribosome recycling factor
MSETLDTCTERMTKSIEALKNEFNQIRTGRASASLFDRVRVEYYGDRCPLNQVATVQIPEARMVVINPYDKSLIKEIEKAILAADLGLNPSNDGKVIRISIPPLTADRRKELCKQAKNTAENSRVSIRNIRRDGNDAFKKLKGSDVSEDEIKDLETQLQKITDKYIAEVDKAVEVKSKEVLTV